MSYEQGVSVAGRVERFLAFPNDGLFISTPPLFVAGQSRRPDSCPICADKLQN